MREQDEEVIRKETSLLFEPLSKWLLLVCLLLAVWFRFFPIIVISTFLLLLSFMITVWKNQSLTHIRPSVKISKPRLFADEEFFVDASVFNNKWLPLVWLEWEFPERKELIWGEDQRDRYLVRFLWLLWYQRLKWTMKGKALERGVFPLGKVILRSGDGFRFTETEQEVDLNDTLYVYPKLMSLHVPALPTTMQWASLGKRGGFMEDPLLVTGTRDYQPGDEWRRLNWRASARIGKLQSNVFQPVVSQQVVIYVDVRGFVIEENEDDGDDPEKIQKYIAKQKENFEWFLSVIASTAVAYHEQGILTGYAGNAQNYLGEKTEALRPEKQITPFLDELATMTPRVGTQKMTALDEWLHQEKRSAPVFIFCERIVQEHYLWWEQHKHQVSDIHFFHMYDSKYAEKIGNTKRMDSLISTSGGSRKGSYDETR